MKKIITILAIFAFCTLTISCNKDDETPVKPAELSFENKTLVNIPEYVSTGIIPAYSEINVTANGTIKDFSKITLEMNIQHDYQRDLRFELVAPDGTYRTFIYRRGLSGKYLEDQTLKFNSSFTTMLPDDGSNFLAGNYREAKGSISSQIPELEPIFSFLQDKNVAGIWKLKATDWSEVYTGSIRSWRLVFADGALSQ